VRLKSLLASAILLAAIGQASAEDARIRGVVELFTSQGCDACPKADRVLGELAGQSDIVALAYHVDYWDYRGWRDTLATADNTERQRAYVKALKGRTVYTPQAVVNGRSHLNGADGRAMKAKLAQTTALPVDVTLRKDHDILLIEIGGNRDNQPQNAHVLLVSYDAAHAVTMERGENAGQTVTYWNAVRDMQTTGMWHGQPLRFEIPFSEIAKKGRGGCAVLVQAVDANGAPGAILGAASMPLDEAASSAN